MNQSIVVKKEFELNKQNPNYEVFYFVSWFIFWQEIDHEGLAWSSHKQSQSFAKWLRTELIFVVIKGLSIEKLEWLKELVI